VFGSVCFYKCLRSQVYAGGELLGGCDIIMELAADGQLKSSIEEALQAAPSVQSVRERVEALTKSAPVILFMKVRCHLLQFHTGQRNQFVA
jgi:glutaredoxin-related protein